MVNTCRREYIHEGSIDNRVIFLPPLMSQAISHCRIHQNLRRRAKENHLLITICGGGQSMGPFGPFSCCYVDR